MEVSEHEKRTIRARSGTVGAFHPPRRRASPGRCGRAGTGAEDRGQPLGRALRNTLFLEGHGASTG